jgi:carbamoyl-phosphate synthase large subunit
VKNNECNIVFTSVGRRVALIRHFRDTLERLGVQGNLIGLDVSTDAPAFHIVDRAYTVCRIDDPAYIGYVIEICRREKARLLFPLIDTDLKKLADNRKRFADEGTAAVVSDPSVIEMSYDKRKTFEFFLSQGIPTPALFDTEVLSPDRLPYPVLIKPRTGSAGLGVHKINNSRELLFFKDYVPDPVIQEYIQGAEITFDMLFDFSGALRCAVPRKRIEVRAGEVSKGVIIDDPGVVSGACEVGKKLRGCRGCINVQCFLKDDGALSFVELNPRFGGGVPLSLYAGADFPRWIIEMHLGKDPGDIFDAYKKNVYMLRYDDAVFLDGPLPGGNAV